MECRSVGSLLVTTNEGWFYDGDSRILPAFIIALIGLLIPMTLVFYLVGKSGWSPSDVSSIIGVFTSVVGTLVGAFLGAQVGAAGKDKAQALANQALAALDPPAAKAILEKLAR